MGRQMYDKRTLRKMFSDSFQQAIDQLDKDCLNDQSQPALAASPCQNVFARKRPLFPAEAAAGEFDVVRPTHDGVVVHGCMMRADLKKPYVASFFAPIPTFNEHASTTDVVKHLGVDKLVDSSLHGACNACCCFGQTGSGKTYTMSGILDAVGQQLFPQQPSHTSQQLWHEVSSSRGTIGVEVTLMCYEVCGRTVHDLLQARSRVKVADNVGGPVQVSAKSCKLSSWAQWISVVGVAQRQRRTCATARNDVSSRSHAFYHLRFQQGRGLTGELLLVDLGGAERATDSSHHDAVQQQQSAEINSSLAVLKDCLRLTQQQQQQLAAGSRPRTPVAHIPFRESLLTRLLRPALQGGSPATITTTTSSSSRRSSAGGAGYSPAATAGGPVGRLMVLVTLSPCASDTEATLNTLLHALVMSGAEVGRDRDMLLGELDIPVVTRAKQQHSGGTTSSSRGLPASPLQCMDAAPGGLPPAKWSQAQVVEWLGQVGGSRFKDVVGHLTSTTDGRALSRMPELRFKQLCGGDAARGAALFKLFQDEVKAASVSRAAAARQVAGQSRTSSRVG